MATAVESAAGERPSVRDEARASIVWVILVLLVGVFVLAHEVGRGWDRWTLYRTHGSYGAAIPDPGPGGFWRITAVTPDGPMTGAGVRPGDDVRFDRSLDKWRTPRVGETIGFTLRHAGALSHHTVTLGARPAADPRDRALAIAGLFTFGVSSLTCLIGMFAALRCRRRVSVLLFGAAFICLGFSGNLATAAESDPRVFPAFIALAEVVYGAGPPLFLAFALAARRETHDRISRAWGAILVVYAAAQAVTVAYSLWLAFTSITLVSNEASVTAQVVLRDLGYLLTLLALGLAWRESQGRVRTRYAYMLLASGVLMLSIMVTSGGINLTGNDWTLNNPLVLFQIVGSLAGAGVFAYAVLRHRVVDVGFAVNRTLIYGVVSATLLTAFGLIEWAANHFVPIEGRENNALADAAVAVGVFLTFHRVRDGVEHVIERLFFRRWQTAEAALRRFVREAAFAVRAETLTRGFAEALVAYAEGAEAGVYILGPDGGYRRAGGRIAGVRETLDQDDPALIAIRAEPRALRPEQTGSILKAQLIAPMVNRNEVIGLALLGPKPSGLDLRPDEIDLIGWATRQVGLDLHALKVEQLEAAATALREENARIEARNQELRIALGARAT